MHADLDMVATVRGFWFPWLFPWNSLTNWIMMDSTLPSQPSPAATYLFMLSASHVQCASWFSIAFGSTRWRGLSGGLAPFVPQVFLLSGVVKNFLRGKGGGQEASSPGKFLWLDSLKCNFLHSLDHSWLTRKVFWGNKKGSQKMKYLIWQL